MKKEKVLVTGGAGFIGSHLVDALIMRGYEVHVVDTFAAGHVEGRTNAQATYHEIDIRESEKLAPLMQGTAYVFHEAANPSVQYSVEQPVDSFSINVGGTIAILKAAADAKVKRLIFAASCAAYGDQPQLPHTETMDPKPATPYGLQKRMCELACRLWSEAYGLPTVSLRYFNVYGPRMDPRGAYALMIGKFISQRKADEPLTVVGDGTHTRDFVHVHDIVEGNLRAMESKKVGKGEIINLGTGKEASVNYIASLIGGPITTLPPRLEQAHARADIGLAKALLEWEPKISLEEGIAELKKEAGIV